MSIRTRFLRGLAGQLGRPEGLRGRVLARGLNRGNRAAVTAAVDAGDLTAGDRAADVGFGGGIGLGLLLAAVQPGGQVDGVDLSTTMVERAQRTYRREVRAGHLVLQAGSITDLPLAGSSLDAVVTVNTIYFVADLERAFRELFRVLSPTGRAVVGMADPAAMASMPFTTHGFLLRPVDEVVSMLGSVGLRSVQQRRVGDGDEAYHLLIARRR